MSDSTPFGFGRFVPGFDFLQNLAKGAAAGMPTMPGLSGWVAPTVSVDELDKRIQDLKAVQFWLEQNARALAATVQALEVQKMTLATLQDMNVAMGDLTASFGAAAGQDKERPAARAAEPPSAFPFTSPPVPTPAPAPAPEAPPPANNASAARSARTPPDDEAAPEQTKADPMQWWGALTSQFQQIAAHALRDAGTHQAAFDATREMASGALKTASSMAAQMAAQGMHGMRAAAQAAGAAPAATPAPAAGKPSAKAAARPATQPGGKANDKANDKARPAAKRTAAASAGAKRAPAPSPTQKAAASRTRRPAG